ncbi:MAG: family 20 glycosylhydrolase [Clostridia bacterium]|nr:family 20 glycosylhydrolase [Clostridia bacterium]
MVNNIIPTPKKVSVFEGTTELPHSVSTKNENWISHAKTLSDAFSKLYGRQLSPTGKGIELIFDETCPAKGYRIDTRDGILLFAAEEEGLLYSFATLLQMVVWKNGDYCVEKALIEDYPDKDYRALMIDLAREWHPANTIHKYIDLCFILKIKYLHLHFIDDQRYTLPSKAFPDITKGSDSYSYEELKSIRAHANEKGIFIVPEFEAPGHAAALISNYPEIFRNEIDCKDQSVNHESLICAGNPKAIEAIKILLGEICELFPETPYIHIGGDEANISAWQYCPACRQYMAQNGIEDEHELYSEFVGRVAQIVFDLGKTPIVWEGFPKKGIKYIPKDTIVTAWESYYHMADELLEEGFKIINGSWQPLYIVPSLTVRWNVSDILAWNVYNWQHWWPNSPAKLNPINVAPTENVLGAQLSVWECVFEHEISRTIENLSALSERVWTVKRLHDDSAFAARAENTIKLAARFIQDR